MNRHALGVLEFNKVVQMLVERTSFPPGAEQAGRLAPTVHVPTVKEELELVTEARAVLDEGGTLPPRDPRDVRPAVGRATVTGAILACEELVDVARTLVSIADARAVCSARRDERPRLWRLAEGLTSHDDIADAIGAAIDDVSNEVRDSASKELGRIRRAIGTTRSRIDEKLRSILQKELTGDSIQEHAVHIRNGRHVLPVKQTARGKFKGIVHDQSSSGATVFIEPLATVSLNNELSELTAGEKKEIARILRALTARVGECAGDIETSLAILARLDVVRAAARLSKDLDAVEPKLNDRGRLDIRDGRHPVLVEAVGGAGGEVVPLDLSLGDGATTLVISGPNAGGKTVALKTVGLLTLMAQSGLHVPAAPDSELAVFRDIFADIGDEQSIEQSLSTFSSHLKVIGEILDEATADTLVLIDEMGAGTDPDEGAGLAIAILEDLTERSVPTIATTHLGSVKSHVHNHGAMLNGSMAFDPETLEPSFRFVSGIPGASHALQIADSLGLPDPVLARARELRHEDAAKVDDLLANLAERERLLEAQLAEAVREHEKAKLLTAQYEEKLAGVRDERKKIKTEALAEAREVLRRAQSLVEDTVKELRAKEAARQTIKEAREKLRKRRAEVARDLAQMDRAEEEQHEESVRPRELAVGMKVRIAGMGRTGELIELPDGRGKVRVRIKNATVEVSGDDLREAGGSADAPESRRQRVSYTVDVDDAPASELHLRGMRTDEVENAIDRFVGAALLQGLRTVRIVHGKGTGALREKTHEVLRGLSSVRSFRLGGWGEGDTGVTIVELE